MQVFRSLVESICRKDRLRFELELNRLYWQTVKVVRIVMSRDGRMTK